MRMTEEEQVKFWEAFLKPCSRKFKDFDGMTQEEIDQYNKYIQITDQPIKSLPPEIQALFSCRPILK